MTRAPAEATGRGTGEPERIQRCALPQVHFQPCSRSGVSVCIRRPLALATGEGVRLERRSAPTAPRLTSADSWREHTCSASPLRALHMLTRNRVQYSRLQIGQYISSGVPSLPLPKSDLPSCWRHPWALSSGRPWAWSRGHEPAKSRGGELWPAASPRGTLSHRAAQPKAAAQAPTSAAQRAPLSGRTRDSTLHSGLQRAPGCLHSESDTPNLRERPSLCLFPSARA